MIENDMNKCLNLIKLALENIDTLIRTNNEREKENEIDAWIEPSIAAKMLKCTITTVHNRGTAGLLEFRTKENCIRKRVYSLKSIQQYNKRYNNFLK